MTVSRRKHAIYEREGNMSAVKRLCKQLDRMEIFGLIEEERDYQDQKWGTEFDDGNTANDWVTYITQYVGRAGSMNNTLADFQEAMTKVAALAVAAIETVQRNGCLPPRHYDPKPEAVDCAFDESCEPTVLTFEDLPEVPGLTLGNLEDEAVREYEVFGVGTYRIVNPVGIYARPGGTTHRIVDQNGTCHCIAYPNEGRTTLRWIPRNRKLPVQW